MKFLTIYDFIAKQTKYTKASKCCENKKMILASLKTLQEIEALRDALASESFCKN